MPFAPEATLSLSIRLKLQRGDSFSVLMHTVADEASPFSENNYTNHGVQLEALLGSLSIMP